MKSISAEGRRVAFATLGCKVNRADTQRVREALPAGVQVVDFGEPADLVVINTCTVTGYADRESRQLIHRARRANPEARIVVTGCLADRRPEEVTLPGVLAVVPNADKEALGARLARWLEIAPRSDSRPAVRYEPDRLTRPPLKIQDGCAGRCTYCAVAAARGAPRSLSPDAVLTALHDFGAQGCPEVVLSGIDLGAYGLDRVPPTGLAALLGRIRRERSVPRVRLSSIEIRHLGDDLLGEMRAAGPRVCRHLHLPLQSGADPVLEAMARPYRAVDYAARVRGAAEALPGVAVGADVIAGFPGETEADHAATRALIESLPIASLHVFPFSPRPGTPASTLPDRVPDGVIRARARELRELSAAKWEAYRRSLVGRRFDGVLYFRRTRQGRLTAFLDPGVAAHLEAPDALRGQLVRVEVTGLQGRDVAGRLVPGEPPAAAYA